MANPTTNFLGGSCLGFWDEKFKECKKCRVGEKCKLITNSKDVLLCRRSFKTTNRIIDDLLNANGKEASQ